jgi:hypothetical protein
MSRVDAFVLELDVAAAPVSHNRSLVCWPWQVVLETVACCPSAVAS